VSPFCVINIPPNLPFIFSLAFSVTLFCSEAALAIIILLLRRNKSIGGELGGPPVAKYVTGTALVGLWIVYLVMSSLEAYHVIDGF
jgi:solute carrier family 8 (sodium/calcium exchanger)